MKIKPTGNRLLVDVAPPPEKTKGGILLAQNVGNNQPLITCTVRDVGPGETKITWVEDRLVAKELVPRYVVGQKLLVSRFSLQDIEGQENVALVESDGILATVEE